MVMTNSQAILFLLFALDGIIIGILFDFFRILRRSFSTGSILTAIEDVVFWICAGIIILYSIFIYNNGAIRGYMFLGVFCGVTLYMITLSQIFIKINVYILTFIKKVASILFKIFNIPIKIVMNILKKFLFKPMLSIFVSFKRISENYAEKAFNTLKFKDKVKK